MKRLAILLVAVFASGGIVPVGAQVSSPTLDTIQKRGTLLCPGHNGSNPGFAEVDDKGNWRGFDVDLCRALATAILGSPDKAKFLPLSWAQRWPSLNSGEIDIIIKTTDATMSRNTELGYQFSVPYMYGTFNLMAHAELGAKTAKDLEGGTICTSAGTNNARYLADFLKVKGINAKVLTFDKREEEDAAYNEKRCDADLNWGPTLAVLRASRSDPNAHVILPDVIAVAPQVMLMRPGDDRFVTLVNWVFEALLLAQDMGVTQANVDSMRNAPTSPAMAKLLGKVPGMGSRLGLKDDAWAYNVIKALGNYGEIWDRNLGKGSRYKLDYGMNQLWRDGGVFVPMVLD